MDFHTLTRKQLQSLCKKHGIPANKTNLQMVDLLTLALQEKGDSIPKEHRNENISEDSKKVRFSHDIETREYEPSGYKRLAKRTRRTTTMATSSLDEPKKRVLRDTVGNNRGRGNGKIGSASSTRQAQAEAEADKGVTTRRTARIGAKSDSELVTGVENCGGDEPRKGARRSAGNGAKIADAELVVNDAVVDGSIGEARKDGRRSTRIVAKLTDGVLGNDEVVNRNTRSKGLSVASITAVEGKDEIEKSSKGIARASSKRKSVAVPVECGQVVLKESRKDGRRSTRIVAKLTDGVLGNDEVVNRNTRSKGQSVASITAVEGKDESEKSSKGIARASSKRKSVAVPVECGQVVLTESRKRRKTMNLDVVSEDKASSETFEQNEKALPPVANPRKSRRKTIALNPIIVAEAASDEVMGKLKLLHEKAFREENYAVKELRRSNRRASIYGGMGMSVEVNKMVGNVAEVKKISQSVQKAETTAVASESLVAKPPRASTRHASKMIQKAIAGVPNLVEATCSTLAGDVKEETLKVAQESVVVNEQIVLNTQNLISDGSVKGSEDVVSGHSAEVDRINIQKDGADVLERLANVEDEIENELLPENGRPLQSVNAEVVTESIKKVFQIDDVNDCMTEVGKPTEEDVVVSGLERNKQDDTVGEEEHGQPGHEAHLSKASWIDDEVVTKNLDDVSPFKGNMTDAVGDSSCYESEIFVRNSFFKEGESVVEKCAVESINLTSMGAGKLPENAIADMSSTRDAKEPSNLEQRRTADFITEQPEERKEQFEEITENGANMVDQSHTFTTAVNQGEKGKSCELKLPSPKETSPYPENEVEALNTKGSMQADFKTFLHPEKDNIEAAEDKETVALGRYACAASELIVSNYSAELKDGKGIFQFVREEKDLNRGQHDFASDGALTSPLTMSTSIRDNDEHRQEEFDGQLEENDIIIRGDDGRLQKSDEVSNDPTDSLRLGNDVDHDKVANEQLNHPYAISKGVFVHDDGVVNQLSFENKTEIQPIEAGKEQYLSELDDEVVTVANSEQTVDGKNVDAISPFKGKTSDEVGDCSCHETEALDLNLFIEEGEFSLGRHANIVDEIENKLTPENGRTLQSVNVEIVTDSIEEVFQTDGVNDCLTEFARTFEEAGVISGLERDKQDGTIGEEHEQPGQEAHHTEAFLVAGAEATMADMCDGANEYSNTVQNHAEEENVNGIEMNEHDELTDDVPLEVETPNTKDSFQADCKTFLHFKEDNIQAFEDKETAVLRRNACDDSELNGSNFKAELEDGKGIFPFVQEEKDMNSGQHDFASDVSLTFPRITCTSIKNDEHQQGTEGEERSKVGTEKTVLDSRNLISDCSVGGDADDHCPSSKKCTNLESVEKKLKAAADFTVINDDNVQCQSSMECANLDNNSSTELNLEEFQAKEWDVITYADDFLNQSTFGGENSNLTDKMLAEKEISIDAISSRSAEGDSSGYESESFFQEGESVVAKRAIESINLTSMDAGKLPKNAITDMSSIRDEEPSNLKQRHTTDFIIEQTQERKDQFEEITENGANMVDQSHTFTTAVNQAEKGKSCELKLLSPKETSPYPENEVEALNTKGSMQADFKTFLHPEKDNIEAAEDKETVALGRYACDASELIVSNYRAELKDGKGIFQFVQEEKDLNRGQHDFASDGALTSPLTVCSSIRDDDEHLQGTEEGEFSVERRANIVGETENNLTPEKGRTPQPGQEAHHREESLVADANEYSNNVKRNDVEEDKVNGLERNEHDESTDEVLVEVESPNAKDSFFCKTFLHFEKDDIQASEDKETAVLRQNACDASELTGSNYKTEVEDGKGIFQFVQEENDINSGQHDFASSEALTFPHTTCTSIKDNAEHQDKVNGLERNEHDESSDEVLVEVESPNAKDGFQGNRKTFLHFEKDDIQASEDKETAVLRQNASDASELTGSNYKTEVEDGKGIFQFVQEENDMNSGQHDFASSEALTFPHTTCTSIKDNAEHQDKVNGLERNEHDESSDEVLVEVESPNAKDSFQGNCKTFLHFEKDDIQASEDKETAVLRQNACDASELTGSNYKTEVEDGKGIFQLVQEENDMNSGQHGFASSEALTFPHTTCTSIKYNAEHQDKVNGLERNEHDESSDEVLVEVESPNAKDSFQGDCKTFLHFGKDDIQASEDKETAVLRQNACDASELTGSNYKAEVEDGKGIFQLVQEENDMNSGQHGFASSEALTFPHTTCTSIKDNDEHQQENEDAFELNLFFEEGEYAVERRDVEAFTENVVSVDAGSFPENASFAQIEELEKVTEEFVEMEKTEAMMGDQSHLLTASAAHQEVTAEEGKSGELKLLPAETSADLENDEHCESLSFPVMKRTSISGLIPVPDTPQKVADAYAMKENAASVKMEQLFTASRTAQKRRPLKDLRNQ